MVLICLGNRKAKPKIETRRHRGTEEIESIGIHSLISEIRAITCDQRYGVVISAVQLSARCSYQRVVLLSRVRIL